MSRIAKTESSYERIYKSVRRIPAGCVSTYGDVAAMAGLPGQARLVGSALHAHTECSGVPWHRVVNAKGALSTGSDYPGGDLHQPLLLVREGVEFDPNGRIELDKYRWFRAHDK